MAPNEEDLSVPSMPDPEDEREYRELYGELLGEEPEQDPPDDGAADEPDDLTYEDHDSSNDDAGDESD